MNLWSNLIIVPLIFQSVLTIPIDNGVKGYPNVICGANSVLVKVRTERNFRGRIYVKGEVHRKKCVRSYGYDPDRETFYERNPENLYDSGRNREIRNQHNPFKGNAKTLYGPNLINSANPNYASNLDTNRNPKNFYGKNPINEHGKITDSYLENSDKFNRRNPDIEHVSGYQSDFKDDFNEEVGIELQFGECNMRRQRTLRPHGIQYTFTLLVSFHPIFLTKIDRAYRVRCSYMEATKVASSSVDVSMLTTQKVDSNFPMPQCSYHLHKGGYQGQQVRFTKVGEKITHVWQCDKGAGAIYGMLVHSCYVDDGEGRKARLIDEKGRMLSNIPINRTYFSPAQFDFVLKMMTGVMELRYFFTPPDCFNRVPSLIDSPNDESEFPPKIGHIVDVNLQNREAFPRINPPVNRGHGINHPENREYNPNSQSIKIPDENPRSPHDFPKINPPVNRGHGINHPENREYNPNSQSIEIPDENPRSPHDFPKINPPVNRGHGINHPENREYNPNSQSIEIPHENPRSPHNFRPPHLPPFDLPFIPNFRNGAFPPHPSYRDEPLKKHQNESTNNENDDIKAKNKEKVKVKRSIMEKQIIGNANEEMENVKIETDLAADPLVILPFDFDGDEMDIENPISEELIAVHRQSRNPIDIYSHSRICMSLYGFAIFSCFFVLLIVFSFSLMAMIARRYWFHGKIFKI